MSASSTNQSSNATHSEARRMEVRAFLRAAKEQRQEMLKALEDDEREVMELKERGRDVENCLRNAREELARDLANEQDTLGTLALLLAANGTRGRPNAELERRICLARRCADLVEIIMDWEVKDEDIRRRTEIQEGKIREHRANLEALELDFQKVARLFGLGDAEGPAPRVSGGSGEGDANDEMR